jgi:hypothetical protein
MTNRDLALYKECVEAVFKFDPNTKRGDTLGIFSWVDWRGVERRCDEY